MVWDELSKKRGQQLLLSIPMMRDLELVVCMKRRVMTDQYEHTLTW